jgi:BlaR1 peptidase M56
MESLMLFLLKAAIIQSILFAVYWLLFRRDTFHNMNRWYLLSAIAVSLVLPFIRIDAATPQAATVSTVYQYVPNLNIAELHWWQHLDYSSIILYVSITVTIGLLTRLVIQWLSLKKIRPSKIIEHEDFRVCIVDEKVKPFSFGHSIYINPDHHGREELNEIIAHEMVHVLQRHSTDIVIVTINQSLFWWNPFAWLLTGAVKQNLEFICDAEVLAKGFDAKHYQYNLLRISQTLAATSIGQHFNFSNLKNRIHMMNKEKTRSFNRVKWLAIVPVVAFVLLAFNQQQMPETDTLKQKIAQDIKPVRSSVYTTDLRNDTTPPRTQYRTQLDTNAPPARAQYRTQRDTNVPPPPPPAFHTQSDLATPPPPPPPPAAPPRHKLPSNVESIMITNSKTTVTLKDGKKEYYNMDDKDQRMDFEKNYGHPTPPPPPPAHHGDVVDVLAAPSVNGKVGSDVQAPVVVSLSPDMRPVTPKIPEDVYIILNGKESSMAEVNNLDPKNIEVIKILKAELAKAKYGDKAKSGVIEVTTKKQ